MLFPGCKRFFFGNSIDLGEYSDARHGPNVIRGVHQWMTEVKFPKAMGWPEDKRFEGADYPVVACNFQSVCALWISDPELVQDIFGSKNALIDKHHDGRLWFSHIIGKSFIYSNNDELWKEKR